MFDGLGVKEEEPEPIEPPRDADPRTLPGVGCVPVIAALLFLWEQLR